MVRIEKGNIPQLKSFTEVAKTSFLESHGHSASEEDIQNYINSNFNEEQNKTELNNPLSEYHFIFHNDELVGYSKVIFNSGIDPVKETNISKLERIYLLQKVHGTGLGKMLFDFVIELAKTNHQKGIWLFVWIENHRAVNFYQKMGFKIVGSHDFKISETHTNPNHQMYLKF